MNYDWKALQDEFVRMLIDGVAEPAIDKTRQLLAEGISPLDFFQQCITPAMVEIGNQFETLDIFLPEMVMAAEIVQRINVEIIQPALASTGDGAAKGRSLGKVALATVQGDLHDIGKNMVALMLKVNGFEVTDFGTNVQSSEIVDRAEQEEVDIIGLSSLLTTCLPYMKDTVDFLKARGIREKYTVIIGGAAPTPEFARSIGADAQGHSAAEAVRICKEIMQSKNRS
jgi:5-methyltetrahydrofolate--homocysteine methyltransferase